MAQTELESAVGRSLAAFQTHWFGHAPGNVLTRIADDVVIVVLEETFSRAERVLICHGEGAAIQQTRRSFQGMMRSEFSRVVERATGRLVRAFVSDVDLDEGVAVELFLLGDTLANTSEVA